MKSMKRSLCIGHEISDDRGSIMTGRDEPTVARGKEGSEELAFVIVKRANVSALEVDHV